MIPWVRIIGAGATVLALSGAGWWAYNAVKQSGYEECRFDVNEETARRQAEIDKLTADLRQREQELEQAARVRNALERDLANEAANDPMADSPGLGLDSLRRLNRLR